MSFENILKKLEKQVENTTAYILVDDLNHLVKGGPLSPVEWLSYFGEYLIYQTHFTF